jgi:S-adenosylmethionine:tRNA ribosyltransferase-isomerase
LNQHHPSSIIHHPSSIIHHPSSIIHHPTFKISMPDPRHLKITDYTYTLPDDRIALAPLTNRESSKLLVYRNGTITETVFSNIGDHLPDNSLLVFNDTKVINARIRFTKETGSIIEVFCLEPVEPSKEYQIALTATGSCQWKCFVGGMNKWKSTIISIENEKILLKASVAQKMQDAFLIRFEWEPAHLSFAEVLQIVGDIPLPPYIKRASQETDKERYQTVYAQFEGSVAAPTAGLHFTKPLLDKLTAQGIRNSFVTLHVGAGTFKPVKSDTMAAHDMHAEWIDVSAATIQQLLEHNGAIIPIGTTSLRTIESLYWMGVHTIHNPSIENLTLLQWDAYELSASVNNINFQQSLESLLAWMRTRQKERIFTQTQILIAPGYQFKAASALVTNFHQPASTLLLLVAAAIGNDWRKVYDYALENDFRFLSYGDANLLFMAES